MACDPAVMSEGGYDRAFFDRLFAIEDRHFWFACRNELIMEVVKRTVARTGNPELVLEAGCGTGNVLRVLSRACPDASVVGMDMWLDGLRYARSRTDCMLVQGDMRFSPFSRPFDVVCLFDVLEHVPDDATILRDLYAMLRPGGVLILTVPAHMTLWSYFDEAARHCRRYSPAELRRKIVGAGFETGFLTQFMATIFPIVWLSRRILGRFGARNKQPRERASELAEKELSIVPVLNSILRFAVSLENRWTASGRTLPFGTSLLVIAYKPATE